MTPNQEKVLNQCWADVQFILHLEGVDRKIRRKVSECMKKCKDDLYKEEE